MKRFGVTSLVTLLVSMVLASPAIAAASIDAPSGVRASSTGNGAQVTWNLVAGAEGYNVYRDDAYIATIGAPPFNDQVSGSHTYYVTAFANGNYSTKSNQASVTAQPRVVAPSAPSNLRADNNGSTVTLNWNAAANAAGYNVYRDGSYLATVNGTSWSGSTGDHRFYVTAFDASKTKFSSRSNEVQTVDQARLDDQAEQARAEQERQAEQARLDREAEQEREAAAASTPAPIPTTTTSAAPRVSIVEGTPDVPTTPDVRQAENAPTVRPTPPTAVWVSNDGGSSRVHWSRVDGVGGYNVYRNGVYVTTQFGTSWLDTAAPNSYSYYVTTFTPTKDAYSGQSMVATGLGSTNAVSNENDNTSDDNTDEVYIVDAIDPPAIGNDDTPDGSEGTNVKVDLPLETNADDITDLDITDLDETTIDDVAVEDTIADPTETNPEPEPVTPEPNTPAEPSVDVDEVIIRDPDEMELEEDDGDDDTDGGDDGQEDVVGEDAVGEDDVVGEPDADEEPPPPPPTSVDATPDSPVVVRDEEEDDEPVQFTPIDPTGDDPEPDSEYHTEAFGDQIDDNEDDTTPTWENTAPDGLDVYDDEQGGELYPSESQEVGEGDYGGDQGGDPGTIPENATGGPDSVTTGQTGNSESGIELEQSSIDGLANAENPAAGTMTSEQTTAGPSVDITIVSGAVGVTNSSTQQVVHNADGTTVVSNQDDIDVTGELGVGVAIAGLDVGTGLTDTHIIENSGSTAVVQDALEDGNLIDTSDVTAIPEGLTVTEIGDPGFDLLDSGTTDSATFTGGGISVELEVGDTGVEASLEQSSGTVTNTSQIGIPTTIVTNNGDSITVGSGETSISETEYAISTNQNGVEVGDFGVMTGTTSTISNATQHTETINVEHNNSANGQNAAQQQADSGDVVLGSDGLYDVTSQTTHTHTETLTTTGIEVSGPAVSHSDGSPIVTNIEVEQATTTTHIQGEPGGTPDLDFGLLDFTDSDDELGQSTDHTITESGDDGQAGFHIGQSSNGQVPLAEPVEVVTASTTSGLTLEMTPEELQTNAQEALQSNPDNPVLQDLADGATLPEAVNNDATTGFEMLTIGHSNANTLEALEAIAVEDALSDEPVAQPTSTPAPVVPTPTVSSNQNSDSDSDSYTGGSFGGTQTQEQSNAVTESANANQDSYEEAAYGGTTTTTTTTTTSDSGSDSGGDESRVICTYFYQNGRLDRADWVADLRFTQQNIGSQTVRGYHAWGIPAVRLMRSGSVAGRIVEPALHFIAVHRAAELAFQMGRRDKPDYVGKLVRRTMEPMCWIIGAFVGEQDWRALYAPSKASKAPVSV